MDLLRVGVAELALVAGAEGVGDDMADTVSDYVAFVIGGHLVPASVCHEGRVRGRIARIKSGGCRLVISSPANTLPLTGRCPTPHAMIFIVGYGVFGTMEAIRATEADSYCFILFVGFMRIRKEEMRGLTTGEIFAIHPLWPVADYGEMIGFSSHADQCACPVPGPFGCPLPPPCCDRAAAIAASA
jgi:hypothetical protein